MLSWHKYHHIAEDYSVIYKLTLNAHLSLNTEDFCLKHSVKLHRYEKDQNLFIKKYIFEKYIFEIKWGYINCKFGGKHFFETYISMAIKIF